MCTRPSPSAERRARMHPRACNADDDDEPGHTQIPTRLSPPPPKRPPRITTTTPAPPKPPSSQRRSRTPQRLQGSNGGEARATKTAPSLRRRRPPRRPRLLAVARRPHTLPQSELRSGPPPGASRSRAGPRHGGYAVRVASSARLERSHHPAAEVLHSAGPAGGFQRYREQYLRVCVCRWCGHMLVDPSL